MFQFSALHLNVRNLNKIFQSFKEFYLTINFKFSVLCFSETWVDDMSPNKISNFHLSGYNVLHQISKNRKGGRISIFVDESLCYKLREDFSLNCEEMQSLSIEISITKAKDIIVNAIYRTPNGDMK